MQLHLAIDLRAAIVAIVVMAAIVATPFAISLAQDSPSGGAANAAIGSAFTYQGRLEQDGVPANGDYDFRFTLHGDAVANAQVGAQLTQTRTVTNGIFTASLDFGPTAFEGNERWLAVEAKQAGGGTFALLSPRQQLNATPYAQFASHAPWTGLTGVPDGIGTGIPWANVVIVAKSGGDFTSIQAAVNSITTATVSNPFLVWVAPGTYGERISLKPNVEIHGAGSTLTRITSTGGATRTAAATVVLANQSAIRHIGVTNSGGGLAFGVGVIANGATQVEIEDVDVVVRQAQENDAVVVNGGSVSIDKTSMSAPLAQVNTTSKGLVIGGFGTVAVSGSSILINATLSTGVDAGNVLSLRMNEVSIDVFGTNQATGVLFSNSLLALNRWTDLDVRVTGIASTTETLGIVVFNNASPEIVNSKISVDLGATVVGLEAIGSPFVTPTLRNVDISATRGQDQTIGVRHFNGGSPVLIDVQIHLAGGAERGVTNINGDLTPAGVTIINSRIEGSTNSVGAFTANIGYNIAGSQLTGPIGGLGSYLCVTSYNNVYATLNEACLP